MAESNMPCEADIILSSIARHINGLSEENRNARKKGLEGIRKELVLREPALGSESLQKVFCQIWTPLLKVLSDPVEKCRELSVSILSYCLSNAAQPEDSLPYVIPVLVLRLGQEKIVELSEEVRYELVQLLLDLIKICGKNTGPYVDDIVTIVQRTVVDPYPNVKKDSCKCVALYAKTVPQQFYMKSETMVKPLLASLSHQHSRVRVEVVQAIESVIQYGNNKSVDDVVSHFAQRLFDQAPTVRAAVTQVVGNWLLDLMDRYSYFPKLIPLLLTSMEDELPDIREQAAALWHDVGLKYERENEQDLKDKIDFTKADPEHYPPEIERPNLGCRTLMYHHFSRMLSGINNDISDWVAATRIKSAQLLYTLLINLEENVTMHLEKVIHTLTKGSGDEEVLVVEYVEKCSTLIGYFVHPEVWVKLVLKQVKLSQSPGLLRILSGVIFGCQSDPLTPYLLDICNVIGDSQICQLAELNLQSQLCSCLNSLITVAASNCQNISLDLFAILLALRALATSTKIVERSSSLLSDLARVLGLVNKQELFERHSQEMVDRLQVGSALWTEHSTERHLFNTLLTESGPVVGELLDIVMPILQINLQPDKDVKVRLSFFKLLSELLKDGPNTLNSKGNFSQKYAIVVMRDIIFPNCVWRAGRTASALRTIVVSCLWALLNGGSDGLVTSETLVELADPLVSHLKSTLEDDNSSTRLVSCRVLTRVFENVGPKMDFDKLHQFYPELLKRLDDGSDDVRAGTCSTFIAYLAIFAPDYQVELWKAHYVDIYRGLLIHLDDSEKRIQAEVLKVLESAAVIAPQLLLNEIELVQHKHRSTHYCDLLVEHVHSLPKAQ